MRNLDGSDVMDSMTAFLARAAAAGDRVAIVEPGRSISYAGLLAQVDALGPRIAEARIGPGVPVVLLGDFNAASVSWLLALWKAGAIVVPVRPFDLVRLADLVGIVQALWIVDTETGTLSAGPGGHGHPLIRRLGGHGAPGLVIFTSGTTGQPKAALHDLRRVLAKFSTQGKNLKTLAFLLFDHIAGMDTLLYCLANGATIVCPDDRSPARIADLIEAHGVEVLPTAPSFLNLLVLSGAAEGRDFSSLKIITYGAEMMPQPLLDRLAGILPGVRLIQKYGTSEAGAPRSRSQGDTSRWLEFGVEERDWRIRDGCLELPGGIAMLGYLNAPSPFAEDGWYRTGDKVERDGNVVRILGRASDVINVGGQKVFPAEIEEAILALDGVAEASVTGQPHPLMGSVVSARIRMVDPSIPTPIIRARIRRELSAKLAPFKVPQKIEITGNSLTTARFKLMRHVQDNRIGGVRR